MRFDIMTLFPDYCDFILNESIIGRARKSDAISVYTHNIRDYSEDKHRRVDDTPYGGGKGMLMAAPPIYNCYKAVLEKSGKSEYIENPEKENKPHVVYMSPRGRVLNQKLAAELSGYEHIIILCGHYEGVDERVIEEIVDEEISIGDYVLTGGEVPACILVDCVSRMCEGVLSDDECWEKESFGSEDENADALLEFPQYTRPYEFHGRKVPDVLLSGHHENIDKWRYEKSFTLTLERRPELIKNPDALKPKEKPKKRRKHRTAVEIDCVQTEQAEKKENSKAENEEC